MSEHHEPWVMPERRLKPDQQADVNARGARVVWRELEAHGIHHPTHKPDCTCHRCVTEPDRAAANDREDDDQ